MSVAARFSGVQHDRVGIRVAGHRPLTAACPLVSTAVAARDMTGAV
jgi:hypothetical protein